MISRGAMEGSSYSFAYPPSKTRHRSEDDQHETTTTPSPLSTFSDKSYGRRNKTENTGYHNIDDLEQQDQQAEEEHGILYLNNGATYKVNKPYGRSSSSAASTAAAMLRVPSSIHNQKAPSVADVDDDTLRLYERLLCLHKRFHLTFLVLICKLFPAGFFWEFIAMGSGFSYDTMVYALMAGIGEASAVAMGQVVYSFLTRNAQVPMNWTDAWQNGMALGTATFCSGTAWQPVLNMLKSNLHLNFLGVIVCTWILCMYCFYFGFRVARNLYSGRLQYVEAPTWENGRLDFHLAFVVGGALGIFVCCDVTFGPDINPLYHLVGVQPDASIWYASFQCGLCAAIGFGAVQVLFNLFFPKGTCWIDY